MALRFLPNLVNGCLLRSSPRATLFAYSLLKHGVRQVNFVSSIPLSTRCITTSSFRLGRPLEVATVDKLSKQQIVDTVLKVVKQFDKIDPLKVKRESHFMNDLGLDSLDHVEVIMAMEDEFGYEISDDQAEKLFTVDDIIKFITDHEWADDSPKKPGIGKTSPV